MGIFFTILLAISALYLTNISAITIIVVSLIIIVVIKLSSGGDPNKLCAWCGSSKIKLKSGKKGNFFWKYRNKDGSKDNRVKDNYQQASFHSDFLCEVENCSAITSFSHYVHKNPDEDVYVSRRALKVKGSGNREGSDWKDPDSITIDTKSENRKGK